MTGAYPPSLHLATLYEKISQRGTKYYVGRLGLARLTLLQGDDADDGTPTWKLMVQQAPAANAAALAPSQGATLRGGRRRVLSNAQPRDLGSADLPNDPVGDLWP